MGIIKVNNIKIYAYHGCLPEERRVGTDYRIDISVKTDLKKSSTTDQLSHTLDYVEIYQIVSEEMKIASNLLEHVAKRIIDRLISIDSIEKVKVSLAKKNPPIGGNVEDVAIIMKKKRSNKSIS